MIHKDELTMSSPEYLEGLPKPVSIVDSFFPPTPVTLQKVHLKISPETISQEFRERLVSVCGEEKGNRGRWT